MKDDMPSQLYLTRRGDVYQFRRKVPPELIPVLGKREFKRSLKTGDRREAERRARVEALKSDREIVEARRKLGPDIRSQSSDTLAPSLPDLTDEQIKHVGSVYYAHLLDEDEETRLLGFFDPDEPLPEAPVPSFEEHAQLSEEMDESNRHNYARGKEGSFFRGEAEEVLTWTNVNLRLDPQSPSWRKLVRELQAASIRAAEAIRARNEGRVVETPAMPEAPKAHPGAPERPPLGVLVNEYVAERSPRWEAKTAKDQRAWLDLFVEALDAAERDITRVTRADLRTFRDIVRRLPPNRTKNRELRGLSPAKAADRAEELGIPAMAPANISKGLGFVGAFFGWAVQEQYITESPARGLRVEVTQKARDERDPFSPEQLRKMFHSDLYGGPKVDRDSARFWVPLIMLWTGARPEEILQLECRGVEERDDIAAIRIRELHEESHVKTEAGNRTIPIHPELVRIGLLDLVAQRRKERGGRLFPDAKRGEDGYYSSVFSKWANRWLDSVGVKTKKTVLYSLRHNFKDALREADVDEPKQKQLMGHADPSMSGRYGAGYSTRALHEAVSRVSYPGLDLRQLHRCD